MSVTLAGMNKDVRRAADELLDLGWYLNGHMLMPPAGSSERPVPLPGNSKQGPSRALKAALRRARAAVDYTDALVEAGVTVTGVVEPPHDPVIVSVTEAIKAGDPVGWETAKMKAAIMDGAERRRHDPQVVRQEPWLARKQPGKHGGLRYPSPAVVEREWSDGRIDYVCAEPGCDWTSDNPKSVSAHYGHAHGRVGQGKTPQPKATVVDPEYTEPTRHYTPTDRLVALVAEQVRLALAAGMDPEALAAALLTWMNERPDLPEPEPREPLTDAQIVERIRVLVSAPTAAAVAEAEAEAALLREQLALVIGERDRLVTERQALRDLLT